MSVKKAAVGLLLGFACVCHARAEVVLQYFNTSWNEIATRMPEVAEAGYTALWLPPPFVAGSQDSVGYDCFDRFNFGSGGAVTRYGTADDLLNMVSIAHRFGLRVYFDNVTAHNGGPIPTEPPGTLSSEQPGFVPEDFHLIIQPDGSYQEPPAPSNDDYAHDEWRVLNWSAFGLDIAQEDPNANFGPGEAYTYPKFYGIRQPTHPEFYPDTNATYVTDLNGNRFYPFDGHGQPVPENVNGMLIRSVRWFLDQTKCDGFRLDDVKGVPSYFFGEQGYGGANKDISTSGYCGAIQAQFNITHGFAGSWNNLRASLFNDQLPRVNAMIWGEDLGQPDPCQYTCQQEYVDAGMRLDDNEFYTQLYTAVSSWGSGLGGMDQPGAYAFDGVNTSLIHAGTHDYNTTNDISIWDRTSAFALLLTRAGLPSVYTDGYHEEPYPQCPEPDCKYFPAHGDNGFLGEFKNIDPKPHFANLLYINQLFARGDQIPKWSDANYCAYERRDKRDNTSMSDADGTVLLFMMARNGSGGQARSFSNSFPAGARLVNYSDFGGPFQATVGNDGVLRDDGGNLIYAPEGGYFAFSWRNPEMPATWDDGMFGQVQPITILQDGQQVGTVTYYRQDPQPYGDPNFNPYGVSNAVPGSYEYPMTVPCITSPSNLTFIARADGSCANILMKLDGGVDLNSQMGTGSQTGGKRDNPPGVADDVFLGYEQMGFVQRVAEKFAARDVSRNIIGSPGCETYQATIGTAGFTVNNGSGPNTSIGTVNWVWHDPSSDNQAASNPTTLQFNPPPQNAADQPITVWVKIGYTNQPQHAVLYYTIDGATYPEGSAGLGKGTTQVATLAFATNGAPDNLGTPVWWKTTLPALPAGTVLRYKIGVYRTDANPWFPSSASDITMKKRMETIYQITNFNAQTVFFYPHNDYGVTQTGLDQGFHVLRTKTFLQRDGRASIYNLNVQTFYYDTQLPQGQILFPGSNDTITSSSYGVVVRTDRSVSTVWYQIIDSNGTGTWTQVSLTNTTASLASSYPLEWRFDYTNIPTNGNPALIEVRLGKYTSSTNMNLTDVVGHFTTLSVPVYTGVATDHVGDGIPDWWRAQYFSNVSSNGTMTNAESCATCDPDGDGMNNLQEYLAGTDPTNSTSYVHIISITATNGNNIIVWTSTAGKNYQVYATTNLPAGFASISGTIPSGGATTSYTDSGVTDATKYYKVKIAP